MGLPLYTAPVESDLRNKNATSRPAVINASRIRRMRRRSAEAIRESRRRAAFLTAAAAYPNPAAERQEELREWPVPPALVERGYSPNSAPHLTSLGPPSHIVARDQRNRQLQQYHAEQLLGRGVDMGAIGPTISSAMRGLIDEQMAYESPEEIEENATRHLEGGGRLRPRPDANDTTTTNNAAAASAHAAGSGGNDSTAATSSRRAWAGRTVWQDARPLFSPVPNPSGSNDATGNDGVPESSSSNSNSRDPATSNTHGSRDDSDNANHDLSIPAVLNENNVDFSEHLLAVLNHERAEPLVRMRQDRDAARESPASGELQQPGRSALDLLMDLDGREARRSRALSPRARQRQRARRLAMGGSTTSAARRPNVGWSDSHERPSTTLMRRRARNSRVFGDINQIRNGRQPPDAGHAGRRNAWTIQYMYAEDRPGRQELPSIHDLFDNQVDGLGDRQRSMSPGAWDTLLATLEADPQPPSMGSSFASTSQALAATTAEASDAVASPQPTVVPAPAAPPRAVRDDDGDMANSTSAPLLVQTAGSLSDAAVAISAAQGSTASADRASSGTPGTSGTSGTSETVSANTWQHIRSPPTLISTGTDPSVVGEDDVCEDSEMDEDRADAIIGMSIRDEENGDGDEEEGEEEEEDEDEDLVAFLATQTSSLGGGRGSGGNSSRRSGLTQRDNAARHIENIFHGGDRTRPMRTGFGSLHSRGGPRGDHERYNNTDETLDFLGIGGMQNIVRSLARREDIPDEWWAEAGLSRTLPREASE